MLLLTFLLTGMGIYQHSQAQLRVHVNLNLGTQPGWGPAGYDYAEYYYMPDIDVYYCVPQRQFVYLDGGRWQFAYELPARYRNYNLYNGYKVVINEPRPYLRDDMYRERYGGYRGWPGSQANYRDYGRYHDEDDHDRGWHAEHGWNQEDYDRGHGNVWERGHGRGRWHD